MPRGLYHGFNGSDGELTDSKAEPVEPSMRGLGKEWELGSILVVEGLL